MLFFSLIQPAIHFFHFECDHVVSYITIIPTEGFDPGLGNYFFIFVVQEVVFTTVRKHSPENAVFTLFVPSNMVKKVNFGQTKVK